MRWCVLTKSDGESEVRRGERLLIVGTPFLMAHKLSYKQQSCPIVGYGYSTKCSCLFIIIYLTPILYIYTSYHQIPSSSDGILTTNVVPARITKVLFVDGTEIGESPVP